MTDEAAAGLAGRVARGALVMVVLRLSFRMIGLVSTFILVRILTPDDFGIVGLVTVAYSVLELLSELSFQLALIRMAAPERYHYDTTWTMGVLRGLVMAVFLVAAGPLLGDFIGDARVPVLSVALGGIALLAGLENVGVVDFQRKLQFEQVFRYQLAGKLGGFIVAIPAALLLRNYWALIAGIAAARAAQVAMSYVVHPFRPRFCLTGWRQLFNFSKWLMVANLQWVLDSYIMTFVVGRVAGPPAVGLYQVAYQIAALPASEIAAPIRPPMYAGFARVADDTAALRAQILDGLGLMVTVIAPMSVGISLLASPITNLFLGDQWLAAIPVVRLCAFYALFDALGHFSHNVYTVLNRQRRFVGLFTIALAVRIPAIIFGAAINGVVGAVVAITVTAAFNMVLWTTGLAPLVGIRAGDLWKGSWRCILAVCVMAAAVLMLAGAWPEPTGSAAGFVRFTALSGVGAVVHIVTQIVAWRIAGAPRGAERQVLAAVRRAVDRLANTRSRQPRAAT